MLFSLLSFWLTLRDILCKPSEWAPHKWEMLMCYVMSSDSWLWIMVECGLVHMWMCTSLCAYVCSHVCTHTRVPCMPLCMIAFKHTFAAMWVERSTLVGGLSVWGCVHPQIILPSRPSSATFRLLSSNLCSLFPNSEISARSPRKPANITTDCLHS